MLLERISPLLNAFRTVAENFSVINMFAMNHPMRTAAYGSIKNKHKPDTVGNTLGIQSMSGIGANGGI